MNLAKTKRWFAGLALGAAVAVAGCTDAGTGVDGQVPTGLVVVDAGGNTVASASGAQVSGRIQVADGQQRTFEVRLTASGGRQIALGGRYTLQARVVNGTLAGASVSGTDRLAVTGRSPGTTSLVLDVMEGTAVVLGPIIPLTVS